MENGEWEWNMGMGNRQWRMGMGICTVRLLVQTDYQAVQAHISEARLYVHRNKSGLLTKRVNW